MSRLDYAVPPDFFPPATPGAPVLPPRPPTFQSAAPPAVWPTHVPDTSDATAQIARRLDGIAEEVERLTSEVKTLRKDLEALRAASAGG